MALRLPSTSQRTIIVGRTGTGKTVAALWHLSNYDLTNQTWVVLDFKRDEHIESIENQTEIEYGFVPGEKDKGLFVLHPHLRDTEGTASNHSVLENYIERLWERGNIGIFCDEGFMIGSNDAFDMCLTQGRSLRIPMIICSQRPAWISRFAFSEADYYQIFHLNDERDRDSVENFVPIDFDDVDHLEEHGSFFFDVGRNALVRLKPVPDMDAIRETFAAKLPRRRVRL